jgi:DNA-binding transcriptional LysR family regulator
VLTDGRLDVLEDEMDVVLQIVPPSAGNIVSRVVLSSRLVICASPKYLATHRPLRCPVDLLNHDCIRLVVRGRRRLDQWQFTEDGRTKQVEVRGSLSTSSGEVMHDWAVAGRGVAQKLLWDVQDDLRAGRLVRLLEPFECEETKLFLTYPTRTHLPSRSRLFIDFIANGLHESSRA